MLLTTVLLVVMKLSTELLEFCNAKFAKIISQVMVKDIVSLVLVHLIVKRDALNVIYK